MSQKTIFVLLFLAGIPLPHPYWDAMQYYDVKEDFNNTHNITHQ